MRVPTADYTSQQNALANKYSAKSGKYLTQSITLAASNANVAQNALKLSEKSLALSQKSQENSEAQALAQQQYYQQMADLNKWQLGINTVQSLVSGVYSIVQARDESKAKTALLDILSENDTKTTTSIANKKSKFIVNSETGELEPIIDSELTEWQNTQIEKIKSMGLTKEVEQSAINSLQSAFSESKSTILTGIANDAAQELQEYNSILETNALGQDLYAVSFDDFINPEIDESKKYASGYSLIDGRSYLSDSEKKTAKESYRLSSNEQRAEYFVGEAAKSGGKSAAYTRVEQLRDYLNLDDATCTKLLQYADTVDAQYTDALSSKASETMTNALNEGALPSDIYRTLNTELEGESSEHKNTALKSAVNAHITWATAKASETIAGYSTADEAGLAEILTDLSEQSAYYAGGAEEVYNQAITAVSDRLSEIASPEAATAVITYADQIADNAKVKKAINEGYLANVKAGKTSAYEACYSINNNAFKFTEEELDYMAKNDPEAYAEAISSQNDSTDLVMACLESYKDTPNYSVYKGFVDEAESSLLNIWGYTSKTDFYKKATPEQKEAYAHYKAFLSGSLIDLMNETASNELSANDLTARWEDVKAIAISDSWSTMTSGTLMDSATKTPTESALEVMQTFENNPGSAYYNNYTGNIVWFDDDMQTTFENAALQVQNDIADQFGLTFKKSPTITLDESGTSSYPVAEFIADNGNKYRCNPDGSVFVVGQSGNLIYYGKLGEETSEPTAGESGKTPSQMLADTLATLTPEQALEELGSLKTFIESDLPSKEEEKAAVESGATKEDIIKKRMETSNPNKFSLVEKNTTMTEEQKEEALNILKDGVNELDTKERISKGYYGGQSAGYVNNKGSRQSKSYQAALAERVTELMKEGLSRDDASKKAYDELYPEYFGG